MIQKAIGSLKERGGSSKLAILKYICANFKVRDEKSVNVHLKLALKSGVKSCSLRQSKETGASGSFHLGKVRKGKPAKKAAKPKAAKPKKAKSPKNAKKPAAKKPVAKKAVKKPAAKKAAKPKMAKTPKKSAAKKAANTLKKEG